MPPRRERHASPSARLGPLTLLTATLNAALVATILVALVARGAFNTSIIGAEEIARTLWLALMFLGLPLALGRGLHMGLDIFRAPKAADFVTGFVAAGLFFGGIEAARTVGGTTPILGIPEGLRYALAPLSAVLVFALRLADILRKREGHGAALALLSGVAAWGALTALPAIPISPWFLVVPGFVFALAVGAPLPFTLLFPVLLALPAGSILPTPAVVQNVVAGSSGFLLLAIPFFILAGSLMAWGGLARRLIELAETLVGHRRAGLAQTTLVTNTLFSGLSGSSVADAALGAKLLVPELVARGYRAPYAAAVVASTAILPNIIPPSIAFLILAVVANLSIVDLWTAGLTSGLVLALVLGLALHMIGGGAGRARASWAEAGGALRRALPTLGLAAVILFGIRLGFATATEAGAIAVAYALVLGLIAERRRDWRGLVRVFADAGAEAAIVGILIGAGAPLAFLLAVEQAPAMLAEALGPLATSPIAFLLAANVLLLLAGLALDAGPAILIFAPLLLPIAKSAGIDPVHFGVVLTVNILIGGLTPPVGILVNVTSALTNTSPRAVFRAVLPLLAALILGLLAITYLPAIPLALVGSR